MSRGQRSSNSVPSLSQIKSCQQSLAASQSASVVKNLLVNISNIYQMPSLNHTAVHQLQHGSPPDVSISTVTFMNKTTAGSSDRPAF